LLPLILGFVIVCLSEAAGFIDIGAIKGWEILAPSIFILSVFFAVAGPIFYRAFFAHKKRFDQSIPENDLAKFERNIIYIAMPAPYLAFSAFCLNLPRFYTAGTILMGIYAVYYFFPSKKRVALDRRIFRVR
jgi:hypothetical protein